MDFRLVLIPLITVIMGIGVAALAVRAWRGQRRANAARTWPQTAGRVIESGVQERTFRMRRRTSVASYRDQKFYAPRVIYEYEVDGRRYQHNRLQMGDLITSSDYADAEKSAARYAVGSAVTVYYDPADPAGATLDIGAGWGTRLNWLIALLLLAITVVVECVILISGPITP